MIFFLLLLFRTEETKIVIEKYQMNKENQKKTKSGRMPSSLGMKKIHKHVD